jgi:hypothetical protein
MEAVWGMSHYVEWAGDIAAGFHFVSALGAETFALTFRFFDDADVFNKSVTHGDLAPEYFVDCGSFFRT